MSPLVSFLSAWDSVTVAPNEQLPWHFPREVSKAYDRSIFFKGAKFSPSVDSRPAVVLVEMSIAWTFRSLSVVWSVRRVSVVSGGRAEKRSWGRGKGARRGSVGRRNPRPQFSLLPRPPSTTESVQAGWALSEITLETGKISGAQFLRKRRELHTSVARYNHTTGADLMCGFLALIMITITIMIGWKRSFMNYSLENWIYSASWRQVSTCILESTRISSNIDGRIAGVTGWHNKC